MSTAMYGVLGWPVGHSASPAMMSAAFAEMGVDAVYGAFPVQPDRVKQAIEGIVALGMRGVNVTIPHKQAVIPFAATFTDAARMAGAVNTLRVNPETGTLDAHNTDIVGWWTSIQAEIREETRKIVVLGSGGAARAVMTALCLYAPRLEVTVAARRLHPVTEFQQAFAGAATLRGVPWTDRHEAIAEADVVVNTTPIGMWPNHGDSPIDDPACLHAGQVVQDIVYRPLQTRLLQQAEAAGAKALDGLWMLVYQGVAAVDFWMSKEAPADTMRQAALRHLGL